MFGAPRLPLASGRHRARLRPSLGLTRSRIARPPALVCDAVQFASGANLSDADTSCLTRAGGLTGAADAYAGVCSAWVDPNDASLTDCKLLVGVTAVLGTTSIFSWIFQSNDSNHTHKLLFKDGGGAGIGNPSYSNVPGATRGSGWIHVCACWDLAHGFVDFFTNGVRDSVGFGALTPLAANSPPADFTGGDWFVNRSDDVGINQVSGFGLAELYFAPGDFINLRLPENMRRLRTPSGKPANLGKNGELVTGRQPAIYMHTDDGESATNFQLNKGYGGAFGSTLNGQTFATASTSPSD